MPHSRDEECTVDQFGECTVCNVVHGPPCPYCEQQAFHATECPAIEALDDTDHMYYVYFGTLPHRRV
jgi:Ni,Fe-hydrogenase I small subunit